jgi:hypothetical protein
MRAVIGLCLLAACTGEAGLQEERPDTVSCEREQWMVGRSAPRETDLVLVISDRVDMAGYRDAIAQNIAWTAEMIEASGFDTRVLVVGGPSCTVDGDPHLVELTRPWFQCGDDETCSYRNFEGSLGDALACATELPAESADPNALFDRLDAVLDDPVIRDQDNTLALAFITADDDASSTTPSAYIARIQRLRDDPWKLVVGVVGGAHTPRLDELAPWFPDRFERKSIDEVGWYEAYYDAFENTGWGGIPNPCLQFYDGESPLYVSELDGPAIPACLMATANRPLPTTPLPCYRLVRDEQSCPESGGWALWVERGTRGHGIADVRFECAPP